MIKGSKHAMQLHVICVPLVINVSRAHDKQSIFDDRGIIYESIGYDLERLSQAGHGGREAAAGASQITIETWQAGLG